MDYRLLHQILSNVEHTSTISELAEKLYLSQPYISQIINRAEQKYNVVLIDRKTPISLTPAGLQLNTDLSKLLLAEDQISYNLEAFSSTQKSVIKIAITPFWQPVKTTAAIAYLNQQFPKLQFEIHQVFTSADSKKMLENHEIDIFWGALLHENDLHSQYLDRSSASLIIPHNHPLYQRDKNEITYNAELIENLNNCCYVSLTDNSVFQHIVDHFFEDADIHIQKVIKVNDFLGSAELAVNGLGITITLTSVLDYLQTNSNKFNYVKLPINMINLDEGITTNKDCPSIVNEVANVLFYYEQNAL